MTDPELLARRKKRYAEDEEYRERLLAGNRARHHRNKDKINARKRHRWATDPEYRANLLARVNKETRRKTQQVQQQVQEQPRENSCTASRVVAPNQERCVGAGGPRPFAP
jgi:hypothetical protein